MGGMRPSANAARISPKPAQAKPQVLPVSAATAVAPPAVRVPPAHSSAAAIQEIVSGFPYTIQASARKLSFPLTCPCCLGASDTQLSLTYTRTTGQRVIHNTSRGWEPPYCRACLAHVEAAQDARNALRAARNARTAQLVGAAVLFLIFAAAHVSVIGLLAVAGGIALAVYAVRHYQGTTLPRAESLWRRALALKQPSCCDIDVAIRYNGWYGSVQTFAFKRDEYARSFADLNAAKIVN